MLLFETILRSKRLVADRQWEDIYNDGRYR